MPTQTRVDETTGNEWASRGLTSRLLGILIAFGPAAVAVAAGVALSHAYHRPSSVDGEAIWLVSLGATSSAVLFLLDRQMRRLLPLATLLKLSLVFPDQAPSRFRTAIRTGSTKQLERRLEEARTGGPAGETLNQAAVRIVELASMLTAHDRFTRGHCERVRAYTDMLGEELHLNDDERNKLRWAAFLHDIGKLTVPAEILNKKGKPTKEEWAVIETHPLAGQKLLTPLFAWLGEFANAAWEHHERWDGTGYPLRKAGEEISLAGRIVAVADSFEVMTATRSYKKPMSAAAARVELQRCSGSHFDPEVVRAMLNISIGRLRTVMGPLTWIAQLPFLSWTAPAASAPTAIAAVGRTVALAGAFHGVSPAISPVLAVPAAAASSLKSQPAAETGQSGATTAQLARAMSSSGKKVASAPTTTPSTTPAAPDPTGGTTRPTTAAPSTTSSGSATRSETTSPTTTGSKGQWSDQSGSTVPVTPGATTTTTTIPVPSAPTSGNTTEPTLTTTTSTTVPASPSHPTRRTHRRFVFKWGSKSHK